MLGFGKAGRWKKETLRLLSDLFELDAKSAAISVENLGESLRPKMEPLPASLLMAVLGVRILADGGFVAESRKLRARVLATCPVLVATQQIPKLTVDALLAHLPREEEAPLDPVVSRDPPSRVEAVRAGFIFTFYWQIFTGPAGRSLPAPSSAEKASIEGPLRAVFRNERCSLDEVAAIYRKGEGSNSVLQEALKGHPDAVFRWFRIGQVMSGLLDAAAGASETEWQLGRVAAKGNLSNGGVSPADCDAILACADEIRRIQVTPGNAAQVTTLVSRLQELYLRAAAKQDSFAEFEKRAQKHGGVFISYSRHDAAVAREIARRLDSDSFSFWLDEEEMIGGADVRSSLSAAIESSCVFLVLLSPDSVQSEWVTFEIEQARERVARGTHALVPVLVRGLAAANLPDTLAGKAAIDMSAGVGEKYPELRRSISDHLVTLERGRSPPRAV